jgi:hypothetical protein
MFRKRRGRTALVELERRRYDAGAALNHLAHMILPHNCDPHAYARDFHENGFAIFPQVLAADEIEAVRAAIESIPGGDAVRRKRSVYGIRNLLEIAPAVRRLAVLPEVRQFVTPILGEAAFATRAVFFDKVPDANWALGWHQDSVIAVRER